MKKKVLVIILIAILLVSCSGLTACEKSSKGLLLISHDGKTYTVEGMGSCEDTNVIIPSRYKGKPVTGITSLRSENITSVTIPSSVRSIYWTAFHDCINLTTVNFEKGSQLIMIDIWTFKDCIKLKSITIPASVTSIGNNAFNGCISLTNVYFEEGSQLTSLGDRVFANTAIKSIIIPDTVTKAGVYIFADCEKLESITAPAIFSVFGAGANTYVVTGQTIPKEKFSNLGNVDTIVISSSVTSIGEEAFCNNDIKSVIFAADSKLESIGKSAFAFCDNLTSIEIPASVTSIGEDAFNDCDNLTSVTFANGSKVKSIGDNAFSGCDNLTSVTLEKCGMLETVGNYLFGSCKNLTSITIPSSVKEIGQGAFAYCSNLEKVIFEKDSQLTNIGYFAFGYCDSIIEITIPSGVTSVAQRLFYSCNLERITIPVTVTSIGEEAFFGCEISQVYYEGTKEQWKDLIGDNHEGLLRYNPMIYYEYKMN